MCFSTSGWCSSVPTPGGHPASLPDEEVFAVGRYWWAAGVRGSSHFFFSLALNLLYCVYLHFWRILIFDCLCSCYCLSFLIYTGSKTIFIFLSFPHNLTVTQSICCQRCRSSVSMCYSWCLWSQTPGKVSVSTWTVSTPCWCSWRTAWSRWGTRRRMNEDRGGVFGVSLSNLSLN